MISFLFCDDAPDLRKITEDFFRDYVRPARYRVYVSDVAIAEIEKTPDDVKRSKCLQVIRKYGFPILPLTDESIRLAKIYIHRRAIPPAKVDDARHVAIATCNQMDILLSWNFKHLANICKQTVIRFVNETAGYFYPLTLTNPMEVMYEND